MMCKSFVCAGQKHSLIMHAGSPVLVPAEILFTIHMLDHAKAGLPLKAVMGALTTCLSLPASFPPAALAASLQMLRAK